MLMAIDEVYLVSLGIMVNSSARICIFRKYTTTPLVVAQYRRDVHRQGLPPTLL